MHIWATASTESGGLFKDNLRDTEIVLGLANRLQETGYAPEDAQRVWLLAGINQVWQRPPTTTTLAVCTSPLQA